MLRLRVIEKGEILQNIVGLHRAPRTFFTPPFFLLLLSPPLLILWLVHWLHFFFFALSLSDIIQTNDVGHEVGEEVLEFIS